MAESGTDRFFLCFGFPKSGTTFLQRMLDMHPDVSCPSEQSFVTLTGFVEHGARIYNDALRTIDRRTGGQGTVLWGKATSDQVFAAIVRTLAKDFSRGKLIFGLNDNDVVNRPKYYDEVLGRPKMIAIFRNPVDQALSAWRHNSRLAKEEPQMAAAHLRLLNNPQGTVEGYVLKVAQQFPASVDRYLGYAGGRANFLTLLYEELVANKKAELRRLFAFLGADNSDAIHDRIVAESSREQMASKSAKPQFFGLDHDQRKETTVSREIREKALGTAARGLTRLGYDLSALMSDR